jgi:hypothetical protein
MEKLYKLLQYSTVGWEEIKTSVTREQCELLIKELLADGVNPQYIKVILDADV